jgi:hypothetical protein
MTGNIWAPFEPSAEHLRVTERFSNKMEESMDANALRAMQAPMM